MIIVSQILLQEQIQRKNTGLKIKRGWHFFIGSNVRSWPKYEARHLRFSVSFGDIRPSNSLRQRPRFTR